MRWTRPLMVAVATVTVAGTADAQGFYSSPTGSALPAGVTAVGGIVADLVGLNGSRLVSQLSASSLYVGFDNNGTPIAYRGNPLTIGIQSGFTAGQLSALGGGLAQAAFRVSLFDGDSRAGNFDYFNDVFRVNGVDIQDFSEVQTTESNSTGGAQGNVGLGFGNNILNTGFFYTNNAATLGNIFAALSGSLTLEYSLFDDDPSDNFYDFTQGIDGGLVDVGLPPVVVPPTSVPEPATVLLVAGGLLGVAGIARRRRSA